MKAKYWVLHLVTKMVRMMVPSKVSNLEPTMVSTKVLVMETYLALYLVTH